VITAQLLFFQYFYSAPTLHTSHWIWRTKIFPEKARFLLVAISYNVHYCKTVAQLIQFSSNYFFQVDSGSFLWNFQPWSVFQTSLPLFASHYTVLSPMDEITFIFYSQNIVYKNDCKFTLQVHFLRVHKTIMDLWLHSYFSLA